MRVRLEATQVELASRLGTSANTVARWERGEVGIPEPAARLGCALFVLLRRERARADAIREELGGRRVASFDRDKTMKAAERAERGALEELEKLLGRGSLAWWRDAGEQAMREVRASPSAPRRKT